MAQITRRGLRIMGLNVFLLFGVFTRDACAYIDPGTGSYIFQFLIAAALGGLYATKNFWARVVVFLKDLFKRPQK